MLAAASVASASQSLNRKSNSCTECQRRKQKCSKGWPCDTCRLRKCAYLCRFADGRSPPPPPRVIRPVIAAKRGHDDDIYGDPKDRNPDDPGMALRALGYMSGRHLGFGGGDWPAPSLEEKGLTEQNEAIRNALHTLLPRPYTDALVQNFLNFANYQYYALYPQHFLDVYERWWVERASGGKLRPALICLILRVCAISCHFLFDDGLRDRIVAEVGETPQDLAWRFNDAAHDISKTIPAGHGGLAHVQQLFLAATWLKSEERWVDAWHSLGKSIREAQELGMHLKLVNDEMTEFEVEMRKRQWSLLFMWDCQCSSLLSRPLIITPGTSKLELSKLELDDDPGDPGRPSPFAHINLQCEMILAMGAKFGSVDKNEITTEVVVAMCQELEAWLDSLPPAFNMRNTEKKWDAKYQNIVFQRLHLHLIGYMSILDPLKPYVTMTVTSATTDLELSLRAAGVDYCLKLFEHSWILFREMYPRNAKFHFAIFCIFDTATVLCSGLIHDKGRTLPRREEAVAAIYEALEKLRKLNAIAKTCGSLCQILEDMIDFLPEQRALSSVSRKRAKRNGFSPDSANSDSTGDTEQTHRTNHSKFSHSTNAASETQYTNREQSGGHLVLSEHTESVQVGPPTLTVEAAAQLVPDFGTSAPPMWQTPAMPIVQQQASMPPANFIYNSSQSLGELGDIWGWQNLNFPVPVMPPPEPPARSAAERLPTS